MTLKGTVFKKDPGLRDNYDKHVDNIPAEIKRKYTYIWTARLTDGTVITQFNEAGEEIEFRQVMQHFNTSTDDLLANDGNVTAGDVEMLAWIPIAAKKVSFVLNLLPQEKLARGKGLFRRAVRTFYKKHWWGRRVYILGKHVAGGEERVLYIGDNGKTVVKHDSQHFPKQLLDVKKRADNALGGP